MLFLEQEDGEVMIKPEDLQRVQVTRSKNEISVHTTDRDGVTYTHVVKYTEANLKALRTANEPVNFGQVGVTRWNSPAFELKDQFID